METLSEINYVKGDATLPVGDDHKVIARICNNVGGWGAGFVIGLRNRFGYLNENSPESKYREWFTEETLPVLGEIQIVPISDKLDVVNMISQNNTRTVDGRPPIRYEALSTCFNALRGYLLENNASLHLPRIGCGLAGGKWQIVSGIIHDDILSHGINVTVYDIEEFKE